jgi:ABC-type multidrug transport system ATPase subunit
VTTTTPVTSRASAGADAARAIRTFGLVKKFGQHHAVDGIELDVPVGAVYGFLGPNGSGKTTTIRMLLGLVSASAGEIELLDEAMPSGAARALPRVGALIEGPAFHPYLSGTANLGRLDACDAAADPATASVRIAAAVARVGLTAAGDKRFRQYSLGMKQRLGIAAALLRPRDLLVFDEPTNGLDPQGTREVRTLVRDLAADGATVLISSHLLSEIEQVATHVGIMSRGKLLAQGRLADVLGNAGSVVRVTTSDAAGAIAALQRLGLSLVGMDADGGDVQAPLGEVAAEAVGPSLVAAGIPFTGLSVTRPALEDFFVELTGEGFDVAG